MAETIITLAASFLIWIMFAGLGVLWVTDGKIKKEQVIHALFSVTAAWILAEAIKSIFPTPRPFVDNGNPILTLTAKSDGSFPSAHSAAAFALACAIWFHDKKAGAVFFVMAAFIGAARVLGNVHYPADILGGAALGILVSTLMRKAHFRRITP